MRTEDREGFPQMFWTPSHGSAPTQTMCPLAQWQERWGQTRCDVEEQRAVAFLRKVTPREVWSHVPA